MPLTHANYLNPSNSSFLSELKELNILKPDDFKVKLGRFGGRHVRNFLDCVKSRKEPTAPAEVGHRTASLCHLNNIAMLLGRKLRWDPKKEEFVGDAEANKLLTPTMREPWKL